MVSFHARGCAIFLLLALVAADPHAVFSAGEEPPAPAVSPAQAAAEIAAAETAMENFRQAKTMGDMADTLTNQAAARAGLAEVLGLALMAGFTDDKVWGRQFSDDADALMTRYGLTKDAVSPDALQRGALPPSLAAHGRQFLHDLEPLETRLKQHDAGVHETHDITLPPASEFTFRAMDATHVQIIPKKVGGRPLKAQLEDGQWRLDPTNFFAKPTSPSGNSPEHPSPQATAFFGAIKGDSIGTMKALLRSSPTLVNAQDAMGDTALMAAVFWDHQDVIGFLLAHGANVNGKGFFGKTALHEAATFDKTEAAAVLIAHGANINARDDEGDTPLHTARSMDNNNVATLLRRHGARE